MDIPNPDSYVIEVADFEYHLCLHDKSVVWKIELFSRIRVPCIFQLNDLIALLFEKMHLLIYTLKENTLHTPSKNIPYIHTQSKYSTYTFITS